MKIWISQMPGNNFHVAFYLLFLFSHKVMSDSLRPHGLQHMRLLCPLLFPRVCSNSCPLSQWCYLIISSSGHSINFETCIYCIYAKDQYIPVIKWVITWSLADFLEKEMAPRSSTLAWKIPWTEELGGLPSLWSLRVRQDWATSLSFFTFMHWRRKWQSTPMFLPGESQGQGEPGGLPSMGSHRVRHDWSDLAAAAAYFW